MNSNLTQWDPFSDLRKTMDSLFDQGFSRPWRLMTPWDHNAEVGLPVDIWETDEAIVLKGALPGIDPEQVDINVTNDVLTIKAENTSDGIGEQVKFYRRELSPASLSRSFGLPVPVDADKAEARYQHGMLYLTLPKAEVARPKQIRIGASNGHTLA